MQRGTRLRNSVVAVVAVLLALLAGGVAGGEETPDYGPAHAAEALSRLPRLRCNIGLGCPIDGEAYADLTGAVAGDRDAQYRLARRLDRGDGIPDDHRAATGWFGKAAEQGHVAAALELNHRRHEGADIDADEAKIVAALGIVADKGDSDAMRALADMRIYGRGGPRDAAGGLGLLRRAAGTGSAAAMQDLATLFIGGAPGIPENPKEGFRWLAEAGRHGNIAAMLDLGSLYFHYRDAALQDPVEGYRWLMRAALADDPAAQEMLSGVLADGALSGASTVIAADPVAADMWLRLAARSPYHDNASLRLRVEARMSSAQLDEAKKRAATWHPQAIGEVLAMTIDSPPANGRGRRGCMAARSTASRRPATAPTRGCACPISRATMR